jgi:hypothetical protein
MAHTIRIARAGLTVDRLAAVLSAFGGATFAALTYSPTTGYITRPVNRYALTLGVDYAKRTAGYLAALESVLDTFTGIHAEAAAVVRDSLRETLAAHAEGRAHTGNTRAGTYVPVAQGVRYLPDSDGWELSGYVRAVRVLVQGEKKVVKSRPLTLARRDVERAIGFRSPSSFTLTPDKFGEMSYRGGVLSFR